MDPLLPRVQATDRVGVEQPEARQQVLGEVASATIPEMMRFASTWARSMLLGYVSSTGSPPHCRTRAWTSSAVVRFAGRSGTMMPSLRGVFRPPMRGWMRAPALLAAFPCSFLQ